MKTVIKIIILAAISAALAIVAEQLVAAMASILGQQEIVLESFRHFTWFLAFSAVVEELSKYWSVYFVIKNNFGLEKIRLVLATLALGALWGIFEIGLVLFTDQRVLAAFRSGDPELLFSFASIVALHSLTAFIMGIFVSAGTVSSKLKHIQILFFPVLLHLLFNFLIIQRGDFTNYLVVVTLSTGWLAGIAVLAANYKKLANSQS